jgi:hypothetical protein
MTDKKTQSKVQTHAIYDVLTSLLSVDKNETNKKKTIPKLSQKHKSHIKELKEYKALSEPHLNELAELVALVAPNCTLLTQLTFIAFENRSGGVCAAIIDDCAKLVGLIAFNLSSVAQKNIFMTISESVGDHNKTQRFVEKLETQYRLKQSVNVNRIQISRLEIEENLTEDNKINEAKQLENVVAIGLSWCICKGITQSEDSIQYISQRYSRDLELDEGITHKIAMYLTQEATKQSKTDLFQVIRYFNNKVEFAERQKTSEQNKVLEQIKKVNSLTVNLSEKVSLIKNQQLELEKLQQKVNELDGKLNDQQELGKAERVHLKDDHGRVKSKTLNLLEEDVLPLLKTSLHALDKETPKTHVAIHNIDLISDNIEGMIKWLKK